MHNDGAHWPASQRDSSDSAASLVPRRSGSSRLAVGHLISDSMLDEFGRLDRRIQDGEVGLLWEKAES